MDTRLSLFTALALMLQASSTLAFAIPTLQNRQQTSYGDNEPDGNAGASGSSKGSSFSLSTGGLVAIIVVVVVVVVIGVASTVLYVLAKRRQWDVRASIRRVSRRLTGRAPEPKRSEQQRRADRQSKRAGIQLQNTPGERGAKSGVAVGTRDPEKAQQKTKPKPTFVVQEPKEVQKGSSTWTQKLWKK